VTGIDWTTAAIVLAAGLAAGLVIALRARGAAAPAAAAAAPFARDRREDEGRLEALLLQLRDLEGGGPDTPERARDRYALELEAARVLQRVERHAAEAAPPVVAAPAVEEGESAERRAVRRGFAWGFATAAALSLLVAFAARVMQPRGEGGSLTGEIGPAGAMGGAGAPAEGGGDGEEAALRARIEAHPDDVEARLELARVYLSRQDLMGVFNETEAVLQRAPGHPRAMSYQALVRLAMGQGQAALDLLRDALRRDPDMLEGYLHLMLVQTRMGDAAAAERTMADAVRRFPAHKDDIERVMGEIRRAGEAPATADAAPSAAPPPGAAPAAAAAEAALAGVVEGGGPVPPSAVLFITVRPAGAEGGPPVAVQRLAARFPARFAITAADSMMGQELPPRVRIEARVDPDGDPLTRSPQDPSARVDGVTLGTRDVRLVLR
jgi:tetratricopeptide (TPR) repeat protein